MSPSTAVFQSSCKRAGRVATSLGASVVVAAVLVALAAGATSPAARACPSATLVNGALGTHSGAPVATKTQYSKTCTYPGGGIGSTKITFQVDTAKTFAASEKAAGMFGSKIVKVQHLGQAAWTTNAGSLYVFDGHETIKILALSLEIRSPSTATAKLEALAKKLL